MHYCRIAAVLIKTKTILKIIGYSQHKLSVIKQFCSSALHPNFLNETKNILIKYLQHLLAFLKTSASH